MKATLLLAGAALALCAGAAYADDETVTSTQTTVQHAVPDTYSKTVKETTTTGSMAPVATTTKSSSVSESDGMGDSYKAQATQTVNPGSGTLVHEEYHEQKNY